MNKEENDDNNISIVDRGAEIAGLVTAAVFPVVALGVGLGLAVQGLGIAIGKIAFDPDTAYQQAKNKSAPLADPSCVTDQEAQTPSNTVADQTSNLASASPDTDKKALAQQVTDSLHAATQIENISEKTAKAKTKDDKTWLSGFLNDNQLAEKAGSNLANGLASTFEGFVEKAKAGTLTVGDAFKALGAAIGQALLNAIGESLIQMGVAECASCENQKSCRDPGFDQPPTPGTALAPSRLFQFALSSGFQRNIRIPASTASWWGDTVAAHLWIHRTCRKYRSGPALTPRLAQNGQGGLPEAIPSCPQGAEGVGPDHIRGISFVFSCFIYAETPPFVSRVPRQAPSWWRAVDALAS